MAWQDSQEGVADCDGGAQAEQEVAEFHNHQQLSRDLVEVSEQIYRLRPVEETLTPKKKPSERSSRASHIK